MDSDKQQFDITGKVASGVILLLVSVAWAAGENEYRVGLESYKGKDYAAALANFKVAAERGNTDAMNYLGNMYWSFGRGVERDYAAGVRWFRKAADGGNIHAMIKLGEAYHSGLGLEKDDVQALKWMHKAADAGNTAAMDYLGHMYYEGVGVTQDTAEGIRWSRKAANGGNANAMVRLGVMYDGGYGVKKDTAEGLRWCHKAADAGDTSSMIRLGNMYDIGEGVKRDHTAAANWFRMAADAGDVKSMGILGYMFYDGRGVSRDINSSLQYFQGAQKVIGLFPPSDYTAMRIWLCYGLLGQKDEAAASLKQHRVENKPKGWTASVFSFMAGEIKGNKLLKRARSDDAKRQNRQLCEAYFYIGSAKLIEGDKTAAISYFEKCVELTTSTNENEYKSAKAELERSKEK